ncbi:putative ribosomal subunit interface protein [Mycobacterium parascrofulaceum ATCC BAA-614]|uniref:Putative ribosomal subunit interface protein n=1 Tax=Mycobacterium parascrofulaceum ATCC BAA-614 TaxID=525368 RepID=D5PI99_9MYCO|nr:MULTISPECIES: HPF/RaiA family ribosome-associated protein [Mycobacterium]EFG74208.1 putative ribosomal subunit interface protein [Mycobacterium parascrofulaceum ATCC BAA-614]OCB38088.1 integrase [Mycobacterium malmoense]
MRRRPDLPAVLDVQVTTHGQLPGADDYARTKIGELGHLTHEPVLHAHVRLSEHGDPAVARRVIAQANLDVNGRPVRAQVEGVTAREAIDRLEARLRRQLERAAEHWEAKRGGVPSRGPHEWRHETEPTHRPKYFPRPEGERRIMRHKSYSLPTCTVEEAALEMEQLDYDFHLFTEEATRQDSVIYREGPTEYRLAQANPGATDELAPFRLPLTISPQPAPRLTVDQAIERIGLLGQPFLFFVDTGRDRGSVLYHRYDGHYGLITPAS